MGAWGSGPFENDGAGDLLADIAHGGFSFDSIQWAFEDDDYLEVDGGQIVIALVELVLAARDGRPVPHEGVDLSALEAQLTLERVKWIRENAVRATSDAEQSELFELWEESGSLDEWLLPARESIAKLAG